MTTSASTTNTRKPIAIVLTSHAVLGATGKPTGWYLPEAAHAWKVFKDAGYESIFVSPKGGAAPMDPGNKDTNDPANKAFLEDGYVRESIARTLRPEALRGAGLSAIFFAGGHGTMWDFADDRELSRLSAEVWSGGGVVSAVCHGPAALVNVKIGDRYLLAGQPATGFSDAEEEKVELTKVVPFLLEKTIRERGGQYSKADALWASHVAVGERLVTGQNPASTKGVAEAVVAELRKIGA